jgi:hypothetical protein
MMQAPSTSSYRPSWNRRLFGLSLASAALLALPTASAFIAAPASAAAAAAAALPSCRIQARTPTTALSLLPSQASQLVEAAAVQVYHPDSSESNDEYNSNNEAAADASWLWDFRDDDNDHEAAAAAALSAHAAASSRPLVARGLVARVFALPSSLIKRTRDPHIAVTKDDVVLFPVVGCRLVPEYSYLRDDDDDDVAADEVDVQVHDRQQHHHHTKNKDAAAPLRKRKVVHVRSLPTVSNPSCRIRNFRDEELVGWYKKSQQVEEGENH